MAEAAVQCPPCQRKAVVTYGKTSNGKERFRGPQREPCGRTFLQSSAYPGWLPTVKQQRGELTLKGSGIRESARGLQVGANTGLRELKKSVRPVAGTHKRRGGGLSGRDAGRSAACGSRRGGGKVEVCGQ